MKKNSSLGLLAGCQVVVAVALAALCAQNLILTRNLGQNNAVLAGIQGNGNALNLLLQMSVEYSQKNPAMDPLLVRMGVKKLAAPTMAPPTKLSR